MAWSALPEAQGQRREPPIDWSSVTSVSWCLPLQTLAFWWIPGARNGFVGANRTAASAARCGAKGGSYHWKLPTEQSRLRPLPTHKTFTVQAT